MAIKSYRPFGALGTSLWAKYRSDLFFRTTLYIIILQLILTTILMAIFWFSLTYLGEGITREFIENIERILTGEEAANGQFAEDLAAVTTEYFFPAATLVIATTLCFGFIMAYTALTPTRRSLERKKRFVSNIAHELRTPLAIVRTNTDVALMSESLSPSMREILEGNVHELERISEIMNNLLSLNRAMNITEMKFSDIDLCTVAQRALESAHRIASQRGVALTSGHLDHTPAVGNQVALEQVAFNLVKNAVVHTEHGGTVTVSVLPRDMDYVDLVVSDDGSGISREDMHHIFEPFFRARTAPRGVGSGLGLTIVSEIVRMHHGKIKIRSKKKVGTTVRVSIPRGTSVQATASPAPSREDRSSLRDERDVEEVSMDFSSVLFHD